MARIFFSYSNQDLELVNIISEKLMEAGHEIFLADKHLLPGTEWNSVLSKTLKDSDFVIAIITENSITSNWVIRETSNAIGYYQERKRPRVIPIIFDDVEVPKQLSRIMFLRGYKNKLDELSDNLLNTISFAIGEIQAKKDEKKEILEKIEVNAEIYIQKSLEELRRKEKKFRYISYCCYFVTFIGLLFSLYFVLNQGNYFVLKEGDLFNQIHIIIVSFIVITLIVAISRFAFMLGKSFMVESLRNSDRIHAISFGEFYLKAFGDKVEWNEVKEAFQNWNIDKGSTFITQESNDYDPELIKQIIEVIKVIRK